MTAISDLECVECCGTGQIPDGFQVQQQKCEKCDGFGMRPIDMIIFCPHCGAQHVDEVTKTWSNPPHRSHECQRCQHVFRVADVPTCGVREITTRSARDDVPVREQTHTGRMPNSDVVK